MHPKNRLSVAPHKPILAFVIRIRTLEEPSFNGTAQADLGLRCSHQIPRRTLFQWHCTSRKWPSLFASDPSKNPLSMALHKPILDFVVRISSLEEPCFNGTAQADLGLRCLHQIPRRTLFQCHRTSRSWTSLFASDPSKNQVSMALHKLILAFIVRIRSLEDSSFSGTAQTDLGLRCSHQTPRRTLFQWHRTS